MKWFIILVGFIGFAEANASASPLRIISLNPALTENLFALGLGPYVVGVTRYSDFPPEAKKIAPVGDHNFSGERIIALKPTHILSISDRFGIREDIAKKLNAKLIRARLENLEDFETTIQTMSTEFQVAVAGETVLTQWRNAWTKFDQELAQSCKNGKCRETSVFIQVQAKPIIGVGTGTFLDSILKKCGYKNAIKQSGYPSLNRETLTHLRPDRVAMLLTDMDESIKFSVTNLWEKSFKNKIVFFDPDVLSRLTPRLPAAALKFCEALK